MWVPPRGTGMEELLMFSRQQRFCCIASIFAISTLNSFGSDSKGLQQDGAHSIDAAPQRSAPLNVKNFDKTRYASQFTGDICSAIANAIADLSPTGGTVDARGFEGVQRCAKNPFAGVSKPVTVLFGNSTVQSTEQWVISGNNIRLIGMGTTQTLLQYTGTTPTGCSSVKTYPCFIKISTSEPATSYIWKFEMRDLQVYGNEKLADVIFGSGMHHSVFRNLDIKNATNCGLHTQFAVIGVYDNIQISINTGRFATTPAHGLCFDQIDSDHATTASAVIAPIIEGLKGSGIYMPGAGQMLILTGTSEQNGRGIEIPYGSNNNTFIGVDLEANGMEDVLVNGFYNNFYGVLSSGLIHVGTTGISNIFHGGQQNSIRVDPGATANEFDVTQRSNGGVFTDNGTDTKVVRLYNVNTNRLDGAPWSFRDTTPPSTILGIGTPDRQDLLAGAFGFSTTPTILSNTVLTPGKPWRILFIGDWANNIEGGQLPQLPPIVEVTSASPTITIGSVVGTVSVNQAGKLQMVLQGNVAWFAGRIFVTSHNMGAGGDASATFKGKVLAGSLQSGTLQLGTDTPLGNSPRMTFGGFIPAGMNYRDAGIARFIPDKPITITSLHYQITGATAAGEGCSTPPTIGTNGACVSGNLTLGNGSMNGDLTGLSVPCPASAINLVVTTPATGCTTPWTNLQVTVQYKMQ